MIRIMTDSTSDLSKELLEQYDIQVIPLHVCLDGKEYRDGVEITPDEIYEWSDRVKETPKTSAPSITDVISIFSKYPEDEIIAFSISGQMSTSCNTMRLAAEELGREEQIHVIDSKSLSTGIGLLVLEAADMVNRGKSAAEIVSAIEGMLSQVRASFVVDTLVYLYRGGRCSGVAALAGSALKLHPQINVCNGEMLPGKKYRGGMQKIITTYAEDKEEELKKAKPDRVFITHSGCEESIIQEVYQYLKNLNYFKEIHITRAGGVISSHCGPGTLGVLYLMQE